MGNPPGMYVPLDVNYLRDPAIRKAGPEAELLYLRSLAYAKGAETDGMVWEYDLDVIGVGLMRLTTRMKALVREGLWVAVDGGWLIAKWLKWNTSTSELKSLKVAQKRAAEATNHQRYHVDKNEVSKSCALCLAAA